jgi:leucyl aminopeptidase
MKISFDTKPKKSDALIVFAQEGAKLFPAAIDADKKAKGALKRAMATEKFSGKKGETVVVAGSEAAPYLILVGLGKASALTLKCFERCGSSLAAALKSRKAKTACVVLDAGLPSSLPAEKAAAALAESALLASYRFDKYRTQEPKGKKPALQSLSVALKQADRAKKIFAPREKTAAGVFLTRDLVTEPPNVLYPESFAAIIKKQLAPLGIRVRVLDDRQMKKMGMLALIAVGQGSARPPRLVTMEYRKGKKSQKPVAFVGKGVTFDTGGISIKPAGGMDEMKWDMGGAGAVTGLMKALAGRKAKVNAIGVVALAENMPDGNACRPGDIVKTMSGQTVEILNTDAEGRLILCDALWYCQNTFRPSHIVDLATLTGAIIVALGHEYAGLFSNDDALSSSLLDAGRETGEELWRMPLHDEWNKEIDSPAADIKNIGSGKGAGSATAAHFLERFIQDGVKWAHLDIAGTAWAYRDKTGVPKGAAGFGVRLLDRLVADHFEE